MIVAGGAHLSVPDMRRSSRHPVNHTVVAEHRDHGDVTMHIVNISAQGFMIDNAENLARGDRVLIRLPEVGRIEGYCMWTKDTRAGFQFERLLRLDSFAAIVKQLQSNTPPRRSH